VPQPPGSPLELAMTLWAFLPLGTPLGAVSLPTPTKRFWRPSAHVASTHCVSASL
jgi:hypothetical protein